MDNIKTNRQLANEELAGEIGSGILSLSPFMSVNVPDIPKMEEKENNVTPQENTNVNNYTVNVNVAGKETSKNVKNVTNNIVRNVIESKQNQSPEELKKNSQKNSTNSETNFSRTNNVFNNFIQANTDVFNTNENNLFNNIYNDNQFNYSNLYSLNQPASYETSYHSTSNQVLKTPELFKNLTSYEDMKLLTSNVSRQLFLDTNQNIISNYQNNLTSFKNNQPNYVLPSLSGDINTNYQNNLTSFKNNQSNYVLPSLSGDINTYVLPSLSGDINTNEFNIPNSSLYEENSYIQKEANMIQQNINGGSTTFIENENTSNNILNSNPSYSTMATLFSPSKEYQSENYINIMNKEGNSNLNVINNSTDVNNILNQSTNRNYNEGNPVNYTQQSTNNERMENYQKRTNLIDGVNGMTIPEMNDIMSKNMDSEMTTVPVSKNTGLTQKFRNLNPTPSTIALFYKKMFSPPIWRTEHA